MQRKLRAVARSVASRHVGAALPAFYGFTLLRERDCCAAAETSETMPADTALYLAAFKTLNASGLTAVAGGDYRRKSTSRWGATENSRESLVGEDYFVHDSAKSQRACEKERKTKKRRESEKQRGRERDERKVFSLFLAFPPQTVFRL